MRKYHVLFFSVQILLTDLVMHPRSPIPSTDHFFVDCKDFVGKIGKLKALTISMHDPDPPVVTNTNVYSAVPQSPP